jgi:hypothetical protein
MRVVGLHIEGTCDQLPATINVHGAVIGAFPHTPRSFAAQNITEPAVGSGGDSLGPGRSPTFSRSDRRYRPPLDRAHPHVRLEELMVAAAMDLGVEQCKVRILH